MSGDFAQSNRPYRVALIDDHHVVRAGLRAVLNECPSLEVVAEGGSTDEALAICAAVNPDVFLLDLRLPGRSGVEACREIKLARPEAKVLFLTSYGDGANVLAGLSAGADGYLLKTITGSDITDAVLQIARGGALLDPRVTRQLIGSLAAQSLKRANTLTRREKSILEGIATGKLNKEIAQNLGLSEKTVRNQLTVIYEKLSVKSRTEAALAFKGFEEVAPLDQNLPESFLDRL